MEDPSLNEEKYKQLPDSFSKAVDNLKKSETVRKFMGERLVANYLLSTEEDRKFNEKKVFNEVANGFLSQYV